ncbi:hypothetical protein Y037_4568 [Burkholderia pseudomallei MSHR983]|nr:hypothetical protein Y037_4568 [Burkholderia pseudomallei MSHR983]KGV67950.1 hypothetical protein X890_4456 [Burkholderia pseudomallei MSHR4299]KGW61705.1 hypothetical protein Y039_4413 [Burkholderia pseudomallei MSHR1029]KGX13576.1 hypothetical protein X896_4868 [Burkholderia pseudomallei ABCPW 1]
MVEDNEFMAFEVGFYWSLHILIRTSRATHFSEIPTIIYETIFTQ